VPVLAHAAKPDVSRGGYVVKREAGDKLDAVVVASGSEVALALAAAEKLEGEGRGIRVVSVPNRERMLRQESAYLERVIPSGTPRLIVEAGVGTGWRGLAGENGALLTVERFGASAPAQDVAGHLGLTVDEAVARLRQLIG